MRPEQDELLRAIPALKEELQVNVELASPADFIPVPAGWEDRGRFVTTVGRATFLHYDLYAQALAKVERGHSQDLLDIGEMVSRGLIDRVAALAYYERIEPELYSYPALDPATFRAAVESTFRPAASP